MNCIAVSDASASVLVVVHTVTFLIGRRIGRYNVVEVAWGIGFIGVAAVAAVLGEGDAPRRWLILALVAIWGLRLSWYVHRTSAGKGEDPRYADLLGGASSGQVVRKVFLFQGFGTFGDACVWWGLRLITINAWWPLATVGSPLLMTYFLVHATGARRTEKYIDGRRGFDEYETRTALFRPSTAKIGTSMTTAAADNSLRLMTPRSRLPIGYRSMTGPPRQRSDLDAALRRVAGGDADAFAEFYDHTKTRVYGLVSRVLRDPGYSEETTQEIYLQVWRTASTYDSAKGSALAWLLTMAHRRAVDRVRLEQAASQRDSRYGAANVDPPRDVVADSAIAGEERRRVIECLNALTDAQRRCIEMAYYGGLTYVEVSQRLSANLSTIKSRMRDALRGLRNCLGAP